jgi:hypothetical protein
VQPGWLEHWVDDVSDAHGRMVPLQVLSGVDQ